MTEFDIASAIRNYVTSHEGVTNFKPSLQQIRDEVDTLRIRLLTEQDVQNRYVFSFEQYYQIIDIKPKYNSTTRKTTAAIPVLYFRANGKPAYRYVGGSQGNTPHKIVTGNDKYWAMHSPYTGQMATVTYEEGILDFLSKTPTTIRVEAVFEKPSACRKYNGYDWMKDRYPVSQSMVDILIGKTAESYLRTMYRVPPQPNTQSDIPGANAAK
jgi:hypothetical protein